jgi:hypothetical protein
MSMVIADDTRTDGSRVKAMDDAYLYSADLEISFSGDEIVRLLMTEKLYGHSLRSSFGEYFGIWLPLPRISTSFPGPFYPPPPDGKTIISIPDSCRH